jgi:murein tripeptide amidase MpaA
MQAAYNIILAASESDVRALALLQRRELWIMPVVNPDGYEWNRLVQWLLPANQLLSSVTLRLRRKHKPNGLGMERKNRRPGCGNTGESMGVDLNRNYDFKWRFDQKGSSPSVCAEVRTHAKRCAAVAANFCGSLYRTTEALSHSLSQSQLQ